MQQAKIILGKQAKMFTWERVVLPARVTLPAKVGQRAPRVVSPPVDELVILM